MGQTNLGQGTHTGIPMVIADELGCGLGNGPGQPAPAADPFKDPVWHMQVTGGSTSIRHRWDLLRTVGAAARQMLMEAAAQQWKIPVQTCTTKTAGSFTPMEKPCDTGSLPWLRQNCQYRKNRR